MSDTDQPSAIAVECADELVTAAVTESPEQAAAAPVLKLPLPPSFETVEHERGHRKATLAAAFRMFSKAGLDEGVAGHVTVRGPSSPTPTG